MLFRLLGFVETPQCDGVQAGGAITDRSPAPSPRRGQTVELPPAPRRSRSRRPMVQCNLFGNVTFMQRL
ncbi:hypothetical protein HU200_062903 [Digitaria exilis]|uniref:Uncharacterized protein n=1 Tax=Digitaria exilis TaxID=1010633 RepID=A0A835AEN0_9POAL|nr:hypothetical protein HU200_062903 [Digitaria exilis]